MARFALAILALAVGGVATAHADRVLKESPKVYPVRGKRGARVGSRVEMVLETLDGLTGPVRLRLQDPVTKRTIQQWSFPGEKLTPGQPMRLDLIIEHDDQPEPEPKPAPARTDGKSRFRNWLR